MTRTAAAVLAVAGLGLLPAQGVAAAATIHVNDSSVHAGQKVRVFGRTGGGCDPSGSVTLLSKAFPHTHDFAGVPAVFADQKPNGHYSIRVRIPKSRAPGRYTISGRCGGGNLGVSRKLRVLAP
jgi:hypothetical protein